ncbi:GIY-YIG nuclease family protein [Lonepinella sp. BR2882]|uniref:GIY-YIG nuclease family protein n=1 Tax=Lonepinella sp. BR2882 TaxID=3095283 RepID=UPI003F6DDE0C
MKLAIDRKNPTLDEIFDNDDFNLFGNVKALVSHTIENTLINNFNEIVAFFEKHQREPDSTGHLDEVRLARRLNNIRKNPDSCEKLAEFDRFGLLCEKKKSIDSLDDIFSDDSLGLLDLPNQEILQLVNVSPQYKVKNTIDDPVGTRSVCDEFEKFSPIFQFIQNLMDDKQMISKRQKTESVGVGDIFILQGLLCFVVNKQDEERQSERKTYRLRIIFSNGTESNMLSRSLSVALYKDEASRRLMFKDENHRNSYYSQLFNKRTGYIYVAKLVNPKPELVNYRDLYKIGFTTNTVEERLQNCENDIAFLESKVVPVVRFECYALNPHRLETLLHEFLYAQRLQLTLISKTGFAYKPKEWFNVKLETIEQVIEALLNGTTSQYRMNNITCELVIK